MAVQKARDSGRIRAAIDADGLVDFEKADGAWEQNSNQRQRRTPKAPLAKPQSESPVPETPPLDHELPDGGTFLEAQRQREWERVWKDRDDRRKRSKELLERAAVISALGDLIVTAKTNLRGIGAKLAPDLAGESNAANCQSMVDLEIDSALEKISQWSPA